MKKNVILAVILSLVCFMPGLSVHAANELTTDPDQVGYAEEEFDYAELDDQYTWYLGMIDAGEMSEAFVYGRFIRKGAFSRELVAQMVSKGYFTQYVDEMLKEDYTWYRLLIKYGYTPVTVEENTATFSCDAYDITSVKPFIGYATNRASLYLLPEDTTAYGITVPEDYPIETTAICSNGYYQVHINENYYYIPCDGITILEP